MSVYSDPSETERTDLERSASRNYPYGSMLFCKRVAYWFAKKSGEAYGDHGLGCPQWVHYHDYL